MKANDLKIGNYIEKSLKSGQGRKLIDKIGCQDIVRIFEDTGSFNYEPLKLTEEWLYQLSSGCIIEKIEEGTFTVDRFRLIWKPEYKYWYVVDDVELNYITKVEWVHEWQNKYFALNGTELELKDEFSTCG